jgi:hypothetical protein
MRFRGMLLVAALALGSAACIGRPVPNGTPPNELSQNVHNNTRLKAGSCGDPIQVPSTVRQWVGTATGLVRGKVLKLDRGPTTPDVVRLSVHIQVTSAYGDANFNPGDVVRGQVVIWNQPFEDLGWKAWGEPLTYLLFSDQTEALLPVFLQFGPYLAGRTCFPIMFGSEALGAYLGGSHWGSLDELEAEAAAIVEPPPPPPTTLGP